MLQKSKRERGRARKDRQREDEYPFQKYYAKTLYSDMNQIDFAFGLKELLTCVNVFLGLWQEEGKINLYMITA